MASARKCPVCGKAQSEKFRPFCSKRCAEVDLSRWFKGAYAIPAREAPDADTHEENGTAPKLDKEKKGT